MTAYKMLCLDIDGTLLNSSHKITFENMRAIRTLSGELRIPIILVSARMPEGVRSLLEELGICQPIVCYGGALILDAKGGILSAISIPTSEARQIARIAEDMGVHMSLYKDAGWYIRRVDRWAKQEGGITGIEPTVTDFSGLFHRWEQEKSGPNKVLCMSEPDETETLNDRLIKNPLSRSLSIYKSKPTYLEIMPGNATKTSAIELLCGRFGIRRSEVVAIGDNFNDVGMIEYAGLGIAMGNAPEQVKERADDITSTNDADGVAEAIKKHFFGLQ